MHGDVLSLSRRLLLHCWPDDPTRLLFIVMDAVLLAISFLIVELVVAIHSFVVVAFGHNNSIYGINNSKFFLLRAHQKRLGSYIHTDSW